MSLQNIVNITISRETKAVSRTGFGTINILGTNKGFTSLLKYYANLTAVLVDFKSTDLEYIAATAAFSQSPSVTRIAISRRATSDTSVVTVTALANGTTTIIFNGTTYSVPNGSDTATAIVGALKIVFDAGSELGTFTDNSDGTYDIDPSVAGVDYSLQVGVNSVIAFVASTTYAADLAAITEETDDWYGLILTSRVLSDVSAAAAYIETVTKIFISASADADIVDTTDAADSTTIAAVIKAAAYARSGVFYHSLAATQYPDAALLGVILPLDPGSYTGAFKTLSGITVDSLTETQKTNGLAKNANIYVLVGGENITRDGTVAEGEFIDTIVFVDWLEARMTEGVFSLLVNQPKVPYTDGGIASIEAEITQVLQLGIARGGIAISPAYSVSVPKAADVSTANKAARLVEDITFDATLTGAIHAVTIAGTVQV